MGGLLVATYLNAGELLMLFVLGIFSGFELTIFNKVWQTSVNNGIMTGNLKNFANDLFEAVVHSSHQALKNAVHFLAGILMFIFGIMYSTYFLSATGHLVFLSGMIMNLFLILIVGFVRKTEAD